MDDLEYVNCPQCDADDATLYHRVRDHMFAIPDEFSLMRCNQCGLIYLNPRPTLQALGRFYPDDYFCYHSLLAGRRAVKEATAILMDLAARRRIAQLERYVGRIARESRILDVGCGANSFLYRLAAMRGCDTLGIDIQPSVVRAITEELKMPAMEGSLLTCDLESNAFDGVAMYEYIEHEGRPREVLSQAHRITKPGGWLVIETPNVGSALARLFGRKWCQTDAPRHLVLYDKSTICRMLETCGYKVICTRPLRYGLMLGLSILVALGFRNLGRLRWREALLAAAAALPFLPVAWIWPEFMRVYARAR